MPRELAGVGDQRLKESDCLVHDAHQLVERWHQRLRFDDLWLSKRYLNGNFDLVLRVVVKRSAEDEDIAWPSSEPPPPKTSIRLTALNLLRRWREIDADVAFRLSGRANADAMWADSVIEFLSENVPTEYTERFINGDEDERLEILQEVADKADRFVRRA